MKQEEINDVESRILEAAKTVFVRKGFDSATMGDIAAEAGIGRTSLNYYYRTKEMLFEKILGNVMAMLLPDIERIVDEDTIYKEKLRKIVRHYLMTIRKNEFLPLFVVNELQRDPQHLFHVILSDLQRLKPITKLELLVEKEMDEGRMKRIPIIDLVSTLVSLVVFPFLVKRPLTDMFLDGDDAAFEKFLDRRTDLICSIIENLIKPENNK